LKNPLYTEIISFAILLVIGILVALAGSQHGRMMGGVPIFTLCVGLAYLIQWLAFIPAYTLRTEKFFDLTGGVTNTVVILLGSFLSGDFDSRTVLLTLIVVIWAIRLGSFLFSRILTVGKDVRFNEIKLSFFSFLNVWTLQALWITFTLAAALAAITASVRKELDAFALIGSALWLYGFLFEVIADLQKSRFKANPQNEGKFIRTGLWSKSRHPNYFGEIVLWIGVALIAFPVLQGWQLMTLISPIFVILLLTQISGIPLLEKKADEKWGGQDDYEAYKMKTPKLIPRL